MRRPPALFAALLIGCSSLLAQTAPSPEDPAVDSSPKVQVSAAPGSARGVFRPGDALHVTTLPDTGFMGGLYHIDGQGRIFLPLIGRLAVTGFTEAELEAVLKERYIQYLRHANVQVRPLVRVTLTGGFTKPGLHYVDPSLSLWDVIRMGEGTLREDGLRKMRWERDHEIVSKDLVPLIREGKSLDQIQFRSGDQLFVTARPKRLFPDLLRGDILPIVTATSSAILAGLTFYQVYRSWE